MSDGDEIAAMSDPDFLVEYRRASDTLEAATSRMRELTEEFDRRAGGQWATASRR